MPDRRLRERAFDHPGEAIARRRIAFLEVLAELVPELWPSLLATARPLLNDGRALQREILRWARENAIAASLWCPTWVRNAAFDKVRGMPFTSLLPLRPWQESAIGRAHEPLAPAPTYDPKRESRAEWLERSLAYAKEQEERVARAGALQDLDDPEVLRRNLRWLVMWQVLGADPKDIAEHTVPRESPPRPDRIYAVRRQVDLVRKTVRGLARELGLPPRGKEPT